MSLANPSFSIGCMADDVCRPFRYADGDTFTFKRDGENVRVRVRVARFYASERGHLNAGRAALRDAVAAGRGMWSHSAPMCGVVTGG